MQISICIGQGDQADHETNIGPESSSATFYEDSQTPDSYQKHRSQMPGMQRNAP